MRSFFNQLLLLCLLLFSVGSVAKDCSSSASFECPAFTDLCNETIYVSDCLECDGYLNTDNINDVCFNRKLLNSKDNPDPSYLWRDILGIVVWFVAAGIATACGVGGGGIYVPLGIVLLNFAPKPSSGLSQASIFGAAVGGLILNMGNQHPFVTKLTTGSEGAGAVSIPNKEKGTDTDTVKYYSRPVIDYDMSLFVAPIQMAGAVLGVLIQTILPNWLYLTLAAVILAATAKKTYGKFWDSWKKESKANEDAKDAMQGSAGGESSGATDLDKTSPHSPKVDAEEGEAKEEPAPVESQIETTGDSEKLARRIYWLERDSRQYPTDKLLGLLVLWFGLILLTFFKGGKGVDSVLGIDCTSPWYGVLIAIQFVWTLGIAMYFGYQLMHQTADKQACGYPWHPHDVFWDFPKVRHYAIISFIAGIVAGLVGIGGGMVLGPLMLVMGVHPSVSSATNASMIIMTSSSVAVLFVTAGLVPWTYALTFFCVCFSGAYLGKTKIDGYVKKTGRASILIFMLATIIALATVGCVAIALMRLSAADWCFAGLNKFCTISPDDGDSDICVVDRMLGAFGQPL
eukprot:Nitzschia sp. Nitz4//scaffold30_size153850//133767//135479//NITZ4_002796-RA/size153850-processed-gene-0.23-mRNA-1//1//CDS//3329547318//336//frame0